jgi:DNA-directed RNA polymerase subunit RPC12/RpoP
MALCHKCGQELTIARTQTSNVTCKDYFEVEGGNSYTFTKSYHKTIDSEVMNQGYECAWCGAEIEDDILEALFDEGE